MMIATVNSPSNRSRRATESHAYRVAVVRELPRPAASLGAGW